MAGLTVAILSACLLWVSGSSVCTNYALSWFGMLPVLVLMPALVVSNLFTVLGRHPDAPPPFYSAVLQDFAWTEGQIPRKLEKRERATQDCEAMQQVLISFLWQLPPRVSLVSCAR